MDEVGVQVNGGLGFGQTAEEINRATFGSHFQRLCLCLAGTGGNDYVAAGSGQAQAQALEMAAKRGSVNFFGGLPKTQPTVNLDTNLIHYGELKVVGTHGSA